MPLEDATYIDTLVPDWPAGGSDPVNIGDDNLRMLKKVLQNTFPGINGPVSGTPTQINNITLNTPWQDNSATAGALSNFNLTDPTKDDGTLAEIAIATPTADQLNANAQLALNWAIVQGLFMPVGYVLHTSRADNPSLYLGFGTWTARTGVMYGAGAATDANGYVVNVGAGQVGGAWRVQNGHIVAAQLNLDNGMAAGAGGHSHKIGARTGSNITPDGFGYWDAPSGTSPAYGGADTLGMMSDTVSDHTHNVSGTVTIGTGTAVDSSVFQSPGWAVYVWERTA